MRIITPSAVDRKVNDVLVKQADAIAIKTPTHTFPYTGSLTALALSNAVIRQRSLSKTATAVLVGPWGKYEAV